MTPIENMWNTDFFNSLSLKSEYIYFNHIMTESNHLKNLIKKHSTKDLKLPSITGLMSISGFGTGLSNDCSNMYSP
jgi:hypothetical protein